MQLTSIALTGFMGSGKSTIGRMIASQLGWPFLDIDAQIEAIHSRPASDLFQQLGEAMFRATETRIMTECLASSQTIVALGGAAVGSNGLGNKAETALYRGSRCFQPHT